MPEEQVEIVRSLWESVRGVDLTQMDWDAEVVRELIDARFSEEAELTWSASWAGEREFSGRDGVIQAFKEWVEPFSEYHAEALDYIEVGDHVVMPTRQWGVGRTSGVPTEIRVTHLFQFRDGLIARVDEYEELDEALESARQRK